MSRQRAVARVRALEMWTDTRFPLDLVRELEGEFALPRERIMAVLREEILTFQQAGTWDDQLARLARQRRCSVAELRVGCDAFLGRRP
jgi:hypothetical protein